MELIIQSDFVDKITDRIYLGCIDGFYDFSYLKSQNITHILSLCPMENIADDFIHKTISVDDIPSENICKYFKEAIEFIETSEKVYVHCMAGVSRSPTIVISYIMWKERLAYNQAYFKVKNKRKFIYPNEGFCTQLKEFEKNLKEFEWNLDNIVNK
jgi:protein-tyrosine phosphatase